MSLMLNSRVAVRFRHGARNEDVAVGNFFVRLLDAIDDRIKCTIREFAMGKYDADYTCMLLDTYDILTVGIDVQYGKVTACVICESQRVCAVIYDLWCSFLGEEYSDCYIRRGIDGARTLGEEYSDCYILRDIDGVRTLVEESMATGEPKLAFINFSWEVKEPALRLDKVTRSMIKKKLDEVGVLIDKGGISVNG